MSSQKHKTIIITFWHYNKTKNINVTVQVSLNVNETHYLGHQVDKATSTYNKATADQLGKVSNSPRHRRRRRRRRRSRLLNQRRTRQDHWRSTHDTEDNITTGRDVPRRDGSAVPPNNVFPWSRQRSWWIRKNFPTHQIWHDGQKQPARTDIFTTSTCFSHTITSLASRWLTELSGQHLTDWLTGLTDELKIADCVCHGRWDKRFTVLSTTRRSRPGHTRHCDRPQLITLAYKNDT